MTNKSLSRKRKGKLRQFADKIATPFSKKKKTADIKSIHDEPKNYKTGYALSIEREKRLKANDEAHKTKRILTLDGGGVRGALSLGILHHIEHELAKTWESHWAAKGRPDVKADDFRLCHYFDFIVGTSTGSIIATLLSAGLRISDIHDLYVAFAKDVFFDMFSDYDKATSRVALCSPKTVENLIENTLKQISGWPQEGKRTLATAPLKTGLGIVVRRLDNDHTWLVHNNPTAKYYVSDSDNPLSQWVLASASAPPFFGPQLVKLKTKEAAFADGGLSAFNNPSLAALIIATLKGHVMQKDITGQLVATNIKRGFGWNLGDDKLMLVSIGTGWLRKTRNAKQLVLGSEKFHINLKTRVKDALILRLGDPILQGFMGDANFLTQGILLWMSDSATRSEVHGAAQDFSQEFLHPSALSTPAQHFLTYLRYDVALHDDAMYPKKVSKELKSEYYDFANASFVNELYEIGKLYGSKHVLALHFKDVFVPSFWV